MATQNLLNQEAASPAPGLHRIGSVSRLANVPVSTLRIWESRYGAFAPDKTEGRHRLYDEADVLRASLLRQLTASGHSIGRIARRPVAELQQMLAQARGGDPAAAAARPARLAVGLVGGGLATRVSSAPWARDAGRVALDVRFAFDSLDEALAGGNPEQESACDVLLVRVNALQPARLAQLEALRDALQAKHCIVLYNFTAQPTLERVHAASMLARREPIADAELGELLASSAWAPTGDGPAQAQPRTAGIPARRYSDQELAAIAASPSRMLCECPRHLSEIISQLASFEEYSAACLNDSEEDARVHAHLRSVAGSARALFEGALQLVIAHERRQRPAG
jgi:DNA-binding transcriptional MerR regulator